MISDWFPAGPGVDLLWGANRVYLMKTAGQLELIWDGPLVKSFVSDAAFDGRFAWVVCRTSSNLLALVIIEPKTEQLWKIGYDRGLDKLFPDSMPGGHRQTLKLAPIGPGKALLVSCFGGTVVGIASFDPTGGIQIEPIFEATQLADRKDDEAWRDVQMAFEPDHILCSQDVSPTGRPIGRALLAGSGGRRALSPVIVDLATGNATLLDPTFQGRIEREHYRLDSENVLCRESYDGQLCIVRHSSPDFQPTLVTKGAPMGHCVQHGKNVIVFGEKLWEVDPTGPTGYNTRLLTDEVLWTYPSYLIAQRAREGIKVDVTDKANVSYLEKIYRSNHYGLIVARGRLDRDGPKPVLIRELFRVVLDEEPAAVPESLVVDDRPLPVSAPVTAPVSAPVARDPNQPQPTAAFLDLDDSLLGGLLENSLLDNPGAVWLERNAIKAIQQEQELAGLMNPAAGQQRMSLGKLLQADVLVLLRQFQTPKPHVQLVVCETQRGLRLAVEKLPISADAEDDVRQLSAHVDRAIAKLGESVREICAVPPFVSNDLTYEHEGLKAAYALAVEQAIARIPGILTVELEEAQAIARELQLAGGEIRRPLPLYLLGEFRHEGNAEEQTATIGLRVERGQTKLAGREGTDLSSADAATFVRNASAELLADTIGMKPAGSNPKQEASQLAARAETFHLLGAREEAVAMAEASLMFDDDQTRMHQVAASSLIHLAHRDAIPSRQPATVRRGIQFYLRALRHYERLLPEVSDMYQESNRGLHSIMGPATIFANLLNPHHRYPEVRRVAAEMRPQAIAILSDIFRARCLAKTDDVLKFVNWMVVTLPPEEKFAIVLDLAHRIGDLPDAEEIVAKLGVDGYSPNVLDNPAGHKYLAALLASDNPKLQRASRSLEARMRGYTPPARRNSAPPSRPPPPPHPTNEGRNIVKFRNMELSLPPTRLPMMFVPTLVGTCSAGPDTKLFWQSANRLYVMREPPRLDTLWDAEANGARAVQIRDVAYDGRLVWIATQKSASTPELRVIDPRSEEIWEIDAEDGLPVVPWASVTDVRPGPQLRIKPIEPGMALFVSWFGRMAIGTVTFDPNKGAKVDMFFEGRDQLDPTDAEAWRNPNLAFSPASIEKHGKETDKTRQFIITGHLTRRDHPLLVDVDERKVRVLDLSR